MKTSRRTLLQLATLAGIAGNAPAQTAFPRGPVRLIVPFPPGGPVATVNFPFE